MKRKTIFFLLLFVGLTILGILILRESFFWTTYSVAGSPFRFQYPNEWKVEPAEDDPLNFVTASNKKESSAYQAIEIRYDGPATDDDAKTYLLAAKEEYEKAEKARCEQSKRLDRPCLPRSPGFTQEFIQTEKNLLSGKDISTAEVTAFISKPGYGEENILDAKEYVVIHNRNVYTIGITYPKNQGETVKKVVNSIEFFK